MATANAVETEKERIRPGDGQINHRAKRIRLTRIELRDGLRTVFEPRAERNCRSGGGRERCGTGSLEHMWWNGDCVIRVEGDFSDEERGMV